MLGSALHHLLGFIFFLHVPSGVLNWLLLLIWWEHLCRLMLMEMEQLTAQNLSLLQCIDTNWKQMKICWRHSGTSTRIIVGESQKLLLVNLWLHICEFDSQLRKPCYTKGILCAWGICWRFKSLAFVFPLLVFYLFYYMLVNGTC